MRKLLSFLVITAVLCGAAGASVAQSTQPQGQGPDGALVRIGESLDRIDRTLDTLVRLERTNLLVQRIGVEERRLAPLQSEVRGAKSDERNDEEELAHLQTYREQVQDQINEAVRTGSDAVAGELKEEQANIDRMIEMVEERALAARIRLQDARNDLARARRTLERLDELLLDMFEEAMEQIE